MARRMVVGVRERGVHRYRAHVRVLAAPLPAHAEAVVEVRRPPSLSREPRSMRTSLSGLSESHCTENQVLLMSDGSPIEREGSWL